MHGFSSEVFFDRYAQAFASGTAADVAAFYAAPCLSIRADGAQVTWGSAREVEAFFEAALAQYRSLGMSDFAGHAMQSYALGDGCVFLSCRWQMLDAAQRTIKGWDQSYVFRRHGPTWRICVSIFHLQDGSKP